MIELMLRIRAFVNIPTRKALRRADEREIPAISGQCLRVLMILP